MIDVDEARCVCRHGADVHGRNNWPGCLLCSCFKFRPPSVARNEEPVTLSKYSTSAIELLETGQALQGVGHDAMMAFVKDGRGRVYPPKAQLVGRGDLSYALHVVLSGSLFIEKELAKGCELGPGDVAGDLRAFTGYPRWATIVTLNSAATLEVNTQHLRGAFAEYPDLFRCVVRRVMPFSEHPEEIVKSAVWAAAHRQPAGPAAPVEKKDPAAEKGAAIAARWQVLKEEQEALERAQRVAREAIKSQTVRNAKKKR